MTPTLPPRALIVSHGQPSDPEGAEAELALLAADVARALPKGWQVGAATLAAPGALARAVAAGGPAGLVFPMFMAGGWFTARHLPDRLVAAGGGPGWRVLAPFGCDPGVQALTVTLVAEALARSGCPPHQTEILLAAHGSSRSAAPSEVALAMALRIGRDLGLRRVLAAFIDQVPRIAEVAGDLGPQALCLPFFAARGGHVTADIPEALAEAGFTGQLLDPVGCDARVPGLIADALLRAAGGQPS